MIIRLTAIAVVSALLGLLALGFKLSKEGRVDTDVPRVLGPIEEIQWAVVIVAGADGSIEIDGTPTDREGVTDHVAMMIDDADSPILIKISPEADDLMLMGLLAAVHKGGAYNNVTVMHVEE